jgi:hypothetical protein
MLRHYASKLIESAPHPDKVSGEPDKVSIRKLIDPLLALPLDLTLSHTSTNAKVNNYSVIAGSLARARELVFH